MSKRLERSRIYLSREEYQMILRLRNLRNRSDCGILVLTWREKQLSLLTMEKGVELLAREAGD